MRLGIQNLKIEADQMSAHVLVDGRPAFAVSGGLTKGPFSCFQLPDQGLEECQARIAQVDAFCRKHASFEVPGHAACQPTVPIAVRDLVFAQRYGIHGLVDGRTHPGRTTALQTSLPGKYVIATDAWSKRGTKVAFEVRDDATATSVTKALADYNERIVPFMGKPRYSAPQTVSAQLIEFGTDVVVVRHFDRPTWAYDDTENAIAHTPRRPMAMSSGLG